MNEVASDPRQRVSENEDVTRYVGGAHFDGTTGQLNASAFDRTRKDDDGLSVNRVNVFSGDVNEDRTQLRQVMASRMSLGRSAIFAQLNIGAALAALAEFEEDLFVGRDPLGADGTKLANPAHALFIGLPFKGEAIGSLKAEIAGDRLRALVHDHFTAIE